MGKKDLRGSEGEDEGDGGPVETEGNLLADRDAAAYLVQFIHIMRRAFPPRVHCHIDRRTCLSSGAELIFLLRGEKMSPAKRYLHIIGWSFDTPLFKMDLRTWRCLHSSCRKARRDSVDMTGLQGCRGRRI